VLCSDALRGSPLRIVGGYTEGYRVSASGSNTEAPFLSLGSAKRDSAVSGLAPCPGTVGDAPSWIGYTRRFPVFVGRHAYDICISDTGRRGSLGT